MKKIFTLIFVAVTLMNLTACKQNKQDATVKGTTTVSPDPIPDSVLVDYPTAKKYVGNYASHAGFVDDKAGYPSVAKRPDTRCIWFSKERLKQMVTTLESEGGDGVRFYLITYDNQYNKTATKNCPDKQYWGYNTLLMVSTKDSIINKTAVHPDTLHQDYYTNEVVAAKRGSVKKPGFIVGATPSNRGELCPPPSACPPTGATLLAD
ncbi:hypothetical protein [Pedobacter sp. L105]|uniref:hypothetical protein n=1 Tax=Pedobacter sp. L105 TaxID=1641871 RepID=UPI00131DB9C7|nr:hypothetical protein [Pedobacter sp. L105]